MSMRTAHLAPLLWLTPATDFCFCFLNYGIRLFNGAICFVLKHEFLLKKCLATSHWLKQLSFDNYNRSQAHSLHIWAHRASVFEIFIFERQP